MTPFRVALYGRANCCLCDQAEALLESLRPEWDFTLEKIDIDDDPDLSERWNCHIPVITINGGFRVALRITTPRLRRAFKRAAASHRNTL